MNSKIQNKPRKSREMANVDKLYLLMAIDSRLYVDRQLLAAMLPNIPPGTISGRLANLEKKGLIKKKGEITRNVPLLRILFQLPATWNPVASPKAALVMGDQTVDFYVKTQDWNWDRACYVVTKETK